MSKAARSTFEFTGQSTGRAAGRSLDPSVRSPSRWAARLALAFGALGGVAGCTAATTTTPSGEAVEATSSSHADSGATTTASVEQNSAFCYTPGRFAQVDANQVRDTTTGLVWEVAMRAPAFWAEAAATCEHAGMRLPSFSEWVAVMPVAQVNSALKDGSGGTPTCSPPLGMYVAPFDQAAMPTTIEDLGGVGGGFAGLWTKDADPSRTASEARFTVDLSWGGGDPWDVAQGSEAPMESTGETGNAYRCVK
jgi:hypothetical protein